MNYKRITDLPGVRIAREAMVVGDVTIGEDSCVRFTPPCAGMREPSRSEERQTFRKAVRFMRALRAMW